MNFEARRVIEALRSGVPSKSIGAHFIGARTETQNRLSDWLDAAKGGGRIITGSYGEGKTHLLNTVFNMAHQKNMAASIVTLSRETPFNRPYLIYQKVARNTFLPKREQPGFETLLDKLTPEQSADLALYAGKRLQTDKLYYLLKAYASSDNPDIRFSLAADLQGDFLSNAQLKTAYKTVFGEKIAYSANFSKNRNINDYYSFLSFLFTLSGLNGWIILFDEAEHIGRLGRRARLASYTILAEFLDFKDIFSLFAMHESYAKEVIDGKDERKYLYEKEQFDPKPIERALLAIENAPELPPVKQSEFLDVLEKIMLFYKSAYDWTPNIEAAALCDVSWPCGRLLRTKIRAAIEHLDQLYQYGDMVSVTAGELQRETYEEEVPLPEEL